MNSPGESARLYPCFLIGAFAMIVGSALAQCPPGSLNATFTDVYVAGTTQPSDAAIKPSLAISPGGQILIAFEGLDTTQSPDRREIMAAEFSSSGVLQGSVFPLTTYDADPDLFSIGQVKSDPTVAIDGTIATVAFLGTHDKGYLYTGECDFETPCEALNCNAAACDFDEPPTCNFELSMCHYDVDSTFTLASHFTMGSPLF